MLKHYLIGVFCFHGATDRAARSDSVFPGLLARPVDTICRHILSLSSEIWLPVPFIYLFARRVLELGR